MLLGEVGTLSRKDLLDIKSLTTADIDLFLNAAMAFRKQINQKNKKIPRLRGRTLVNLFMEPSTRTRSSFELAGKRLGADVINVAAGTSSLTKGETIWDTVATLEAMHTDLLVIRHPTAGVAQCIAQRTSIAVINAGDGMHAHPTQALLDLLTIRDHFGRCDGLKILLVGDIYHSRVARSNIAAFTKMGAQVTLVGPVTLLPPFIPWPQVRVFSDLDDPEIGKQDVIYVLRLQRERQQENYIPSIDEYVRRYCVTTQRLDHLACDRRSILLHPGPINRERELGTAVADGQHSKILDQVTCGVALRMAVLHILSGGKYDQIAD